MAQINKFTNRILKWSIMITNYTEGSNQTTMSSEIEHYFPISSRKQMIKIIKLIWSINKAG